jgi:hypothetical protein
MEDFGVVLKSQVCFSSAPTVAAIKVEDSAGQALSELGVIFPQRIHFSIQSTGDYGYWTHYDVKKRSASQEKAFWTAFGMSLVACSCVRLTP